MTWKPTTDIKRNFGIVAHVDAGKTTLTERILFVTGRIRSPGEVHDGNTVTDSDPSEQNHGITISAATVGADWQGHRLQLIDTPGHIDFGMEVTRSLRVLDGAVVVFDGVAGVEAQTEGVWAQADRRGVPRLGFVNKLDRAGADFAAVLIAMRERLGTEPVAITWPIGSERHFVGVSDLVGKRRLVWNHGVLSIEEGLDPEAMAKREELIELCRDLGLEETTERGIWLTLREATLAGLVVPTLCGSAYKNRGIEPLLDAVVRLLPAPSDRPAVEGEGVGGTEVRGPNASEPLAALCFNLRHETFGRLASVRVFSGCLVRGETVLIPRTGTRVRIGRLMRLFADRKEEVTRLEAGEIGGVLGIELATGDTICAIEHPIALEAMTVPEPVMRVALEVTSRREQSKLGEALRKLVSADPSLRLESDPETGQTVLAGLGELHLDIALERLKDRAGLDVVAKPPRVSYREGLGETVEQSFTLSKQTGGPGAYARVHLRVGPAPAGAGLVFDEVLRGDELPRAYLPAIQEGVSLAMQCGPLGGFPILDATVTLLGGKAHEKDSNELAFQTAAQRAFAGGAARAEGYLLEPIMQLRLHVPADRLGDVVGDLGRRRGRVLGMTPTPRQTEVVAEAPLAELFGYAGQLRSLTGGRGSMSMRLDRYGRAPEGVTRAVLAG